MTDVFDALVGQESAVAAMRQYVKAPVHAYLLSGPVGSSLHDTVVTFAAAFQCPQNGCGACDICRLVLSEGYADVYFAERAGLSWRIDELREADRVSRRRPLGSGYQIVIIEDVELTTTGASPSAPALLKSLEETPSRTIFLLTAEDEPALDTIASRCVELKLKGLSEEGIAEVLIREGATALAARAAASAANGNLRRARILGRNDELAQRIAQWRSVPDRLNGTPATSAALATEIARALDDAIAPLQQMQDEEMASRVQESRQMGQRSVANRRDTEAQYKREQRRFRIDELRFGLTALTNVYRDRMVESLESSELGDARDQYRVGASIQAIGVLGEASRRLSSNIDETLLLNDLMLSLMEF
jgi:DNA polymerase-3 subunit delta'